MESIFDDVLRNRVDKLYEFLHFGDINIVDQSGMSLLHYACLGDSLEVANILIENNINLNIVDFSGQTPIFIAVRNKLFALTKLLADHGAMLNLVNNRGESLICLATLNGSNQIIDLLLEKSDIDLTISNINNENVLFYAIKGRKDDLFLKFAKMEPSLIYAKDFHNTNLLQAAIKYNSLVAFDYLKDKISLYALDNARNNAIMYMAKYGNSYMCNQILKLNPIIEGRNGEGENVTEISLANSYDITHLIDQYKTSYDYISYLRTYPLHVAVINHDYQILTKYEYDKNKKDIFGQSILDLAKSVDDKNILMILAER